MFFAKQVPCCYISMFPLFISSPRFALGFPFQSGLGGAVFRSFNVLVAGEKLGKIKNCRKIPGAAVILNLFQDLFTTRDYVVFKCYKIYKTESNNRSSKKF